MKIAKVYPDGSKKVLLEVGDRVRVLVVPDHASWLIKVGELGYITKVETERGEKRSSIDYLEVRTDRMIEGNWGTVTFPPWDLEFVREG